VLNPESPVPLYRQLADLLLARIRSGEYPAGSRITSEHELARAHRIGRPTARQATDFLVRRDVLLRRRGSGTYVCTPREEVDLFSVGGTIASFQERGITLTTRILQEAGLRKVGKDSENPFSGRNAYYLSRLGLVDDMPVLIEDFYLDDTLFSGIDRIDLSHQSLSRVVHEQYYMRPAGGRQNFRIGHLRGRKAERLSVSPDTPLLIVKRYLHFPQLADAVFSELFCRTDRFVFAQNLGETADGKPRLL